MAGRPNICPPVRTGLASEAVALYWALRNDPRKFSLAHCHRVVADESARNAWTWHHTCTACAAWDRSTRNDRGLMLNREGDQRFTQTCGRYIYNPNGKARLERWFRTLEEQFCKTFPSYCGRSPEDRPDEHAKLVRHAVPFEEFEAKLRQYMAIYNDTPHSRMSAHSDGFGGASKAL